VGILNSPQDISGYVVTVYTENLTPRLLENQRIQFSNSQGEVIFTMASPYMYDAAGELSEDVAVEMVATGRDCYQIRMTPNAQWLADKSRVCPVVIDPQVTTDSARTNIIDNYVLEGSGVQTIWTDLRPSGTSAVTSTYVSGNPAFTWTLTPDTSVIDQLPLLNSSADYPQITPPDISFTEHHIPLATLT